MATLLVAVFVASGARGEETSAIQSPPCGRAVDRFFADEVWAKVGAQKCLTCHKTGGDAEESQFVLRDPERSQGAEKDEALRHNRDVFARIAKLKEGDEHRMLVKVTGGLEHGGEDVLKADSTGYRILADFVRRVNSPAADPADLATVPLVRGLRIARARRGLTVRRRPGPRREDTPHGWVPTAPSWYLAVPLLGVGTSVTPLRKPWNDRGVGRSAPGRR
jgi:hypothetical protein